MDYVDVFQKHGRERNNLGTKGVKSEVQDLAKTGKSPLRGWSHNMVTVKILSTPQWWPESYFLAPSVKILWLRRKKSSSSEFFLLHQKKIRRYNTEH